MAKMGRPKKEINWTRLEDLLRLNASLDFCCESQIKEDERYVDAKSIKAMRNILEARIRERFDCTFVEYRVKCREPLLHKILDKQIQVALNGNPTMLIFLGRVLLGQREEPTTSVTINNTPPTGGKDLEEIKTLLKEAQECSPPNKQLSLVPASGFLAP